MFPAALTCDGCSSGVIVFSATIGDGGVAINTCSGDATVVVADQDSAFLVDRSVKEVEQVAAGTATADPATLNRISRRDVLRRPCHAAVERRGEIEIPNTGELRSSINTRAVGRTIISLAAWPVVARGFCTEESKRTAIWVASDNGRKCSIQNRPAIYHDSADINAGTPSLSLIVRDSDSRMTIGTLVPKIDSAISRNTQ